MSRSGGAPAIGSSRVVFRLTDDLIHGSSGNVLGLQRGTGIVPMVASSRLLQATAGSVAFAQLANGAYANRTTSTAGGYSGRSSTEYMIPLAQNLATAPNPLLGTLARPYRRFTFEAVMWRGAVTAANSFSFALRSQNTAFNDGVNTAGVELVSNDLLNAGRWTARYRRTAGIALVTAADTGFDPLVPRLLKLIYTEGLIATTELLVDGVRALLLTGPTEHPTIIGGTGTGSVWSPGILSGQGAGTPAGAFDYWDRAELTIEELAA